MLTLNINNRHIDRFSVNLDTDVKNDDGNSVTATPEGLATLRISIYTPLLLEDRVSEVRAYTDEILQKNFKELKSKYIWTINGIAAEDGAMHIKGAEGLTLNTSDSIQICKRYPDPCLLDMRTLYHLMVIKDNALLDIMRYQMCLYHGINDSLHKLLNMSADCAYGLIPNYAAAKYYYNHKTFTSLIHANVVSTRDGVYIEVGYNNVTSVDVKFFATVTIHRDDPPAEDPENPEEELKTPDKGSPGWLGIYLNQTTQSLEAGDYTIARDGVDITDVNKCAWFHAKFNGGYIEQTSSIKQGDVLKTVYSISKNPNIDGFVTYGELCNFTIDVTIAIDDIELYTNSFKAQCASLMAGTDLLRPEDLLIE